MYAREEQLCVLKVRGHVAVGFLLGHRSGAQGEPDTLSFRVVADERVA